MSRESEETLRAGDVVRICESNSLECSGINPCPHCYAFVYQHVLPNTLRAGNIAGTRQSAESAFIEYDKSWRAALEARIQQRRESATPLEPFVSSMLLEFLEFKEKRRKFLATVRQPPPPQEAPSSEQTYANLTEQLITSGESETLALPSNVEARPVEQSHSNGSSKSNKKTNGKPATWREEGKDPAERRDKPGRGEVKQIAAKVAKESLAPGKSHSANRNGDSHDNPAGRRDGGTRRQ